ncbi:MAG: hypothetical protein NVSMB59_07800 [Vulcanimicrobiaceae bacterium]
MHVRLPIVCGLVVVAAGAAYFRTTRIATSGAPPSGIAAWNTAPRWGSPPHAQSAGLADPSSRRRATATSTSATGTAATAETRVQQMVVYVAGEVARPGLYTLPPHARAADAVRAAGGSRADADLVAVNLAAPLADGDEVAVYARGAARASRTHRGHAGVRPAAARHAPRKRRHKRARVDATSSSAEDAPIDLNHADANELATLPGIGAGLAANIVTVRETSGSFAALDDLLDVGGMTVAKVDALAPYIVLR